MNYPPSSHCNCPTNKEGEISGYSPKCSVHGFENSIPLEPTVIPELYHPNGHPRFFELLEIMGEVHHRKNSNYAETENPLSNFYESEKFDVPAHIGVLVRMSDKWSRIKELAKGKADVVGESIGDTLLDLANYSLLCIICWEKKFGRMKSLDKYSKTQ
jgi:hypothetical protein